MTQVRIATAVDIPQLVPMVARYWHFERVVGFDAELVASTLAQFFVMPALGMAWLATSGGIPAGYLIGVYVFSLEHHGLTAEIDELFVLPEHRNAGIGSALLREAEREFIHRGCTNVSLQLARSNEPARAFYRHRGYTMRDRFELLEKALPGAA